jgi:hypothetical protein
LPLVCRKGKIGPLGREHRTLAGHLAVNGKSIL